MTRFVRHVRLLVLGVRVKPRGPIPNPERKRGVELTIPETRVPREGPPKVLRVPRGGTVQRSTPARRQFGFGSGRPTPVQAPSADPRLPSIELLPGVGLGPGFRGRSLVAPADFVGRCLEAPYPVGRPARVDRPIPSALNLAAAGDGGSTPGPVVLDE